MLRQDPCSPCRGFPHLHFVGFPGFPRSRALGSVVCSGLVRSGWGVPRVRSSERHVAVIVRGVLDPSKATLPPRGKFRSLGVFPCLRRWQRVLPKFPGLNTAPAAPASSGVIAHSTLGRLVEEDGPDVVVEERVVVKEVEEEVRGCPGRGGGVRAAGGLAKARSGSTFELYGVRPQRPSLRQDLRIRGGTLAQDRPGLRQRRGWLHWVPPCCLPVQVEATCSSCFLFSFFFYLFLWSLLSLSLSFARARGGIPPSLTLSPSLSPLRNSL